MPSPDKPCICGTGCGRSALPGRLGLSRACYQRWRRAGYPRRGNAPAVPVSRHTEARHLRAEFAVLREAGVEVREAADLLVIQPGTGRNWERLRKRGELLTHELEDVDGN
jgi:hypothetical protein